MKGSNDFTLDPESDSSSSVGLGVCNLGALEEDPRRDALAYSRKLPKPIRELLFLMVVKLAILPDPTRDP